MSKAGVIYGQDSSVEERDWRWWRTAGGCVIKEQVGEKWTAR